MTTINHTDPPQNLSVALKVYDEYWKKCFNGKPEISGWHNSINGSLTDIDSLAYCSYELGFPEDDLSLAILIWTNAVVTNSNLNWGLDQDNDLILCSDETEYRRLVIYPAARIKSANGSSISDFSTFEHATAMTLLDMVICGFEEKDVGKFWQYAIDCLKDLDGPIVSIMSQLLDSNER